MAVLFLHATCLADSVEIVSVTWAPLAETSGLESALRERFSREHDGLRLVSRSPFGNKERLIQMLSEIDNSDAALLLAIGNETARAATITVTNIPVVYCLASESAVRDSLSQRPHASPMIGVLSSPPVEEYIQELCGIDIPWAGAVVVLPDTDKAADARYKRFKALYEEDIGGEVSLVSVDPAACKSIDDMMQVYGRIRKTVPSVVYLINSGNVSKFMGTLARKCSEDGIPVIGEGRYLRRHGAMLSLMPSDRHLAETCAGVIHKLLAGDTVATMRDQSYMLLKNDELIASFLERIAEGGALTPVAE